MKIEKESIFHRFINPRDPTFRINRDPILPFLRIPEDPDKEIIPLLRIRDEVRRIVIIFLSHELLHGIFQIVILCFDHIDEIDGSDGVTLGFDVVLEEFVVLYTVEIVLVHGG